ncbi:MAG: hypothetical protein AAF743_09655 [Planctomycetota bacterium]
MPNDPIPLDPVLTDDTETYLLELDTRRRVEAAVGERWDLFADKHPRLSALLGADASTQLIVADLMDDPGYVKAMADARRIGQAAIVADRWVRWFVAQWLPKVA